MHTHSEERRDAGTLNFQDVVVWTNAETVAGQVERHVRKLVSLITIDGVLSVEALFSANLFVPFQSQP